MTQYGYVDREGYPLAAWIWGHRLRVGQDWMEYFLEFLNVLAGFEYELGQGIKNGVDTASTKQEYIKFTRLGLRRFVFYDEREKTRHPLDDYARQQLLTNLKARVIADDEDLQEPLNLARSLLRAFTAVEAERSWFAKSLFPAHHNLLFWEALRKGATKYQGRGVPVGVSYQQLDSGIVFDARNFFARGGEIYYLILSAGTKDSPLQRRKIANGFKHLLKGHNQALGDLASLIDQTWQSGENDPNTNGESNHSQKGRLGWIPDPENPFYKTIAQDVDTLLATRLDTLETLDLLAHLMCFHITLYIYHHAQPSDNHVHHPVILIDAMDGIDGGVIRRVAATCYREQEAHIIQKGQAYVNECVQGWLRRSTSETDFVGFFDREAQAHFDLKRLSKGARQPFESEIYKLDQRLRRGELDQVAFADAFSETLTELLLQDFHKSFIGVHKKLAKAIGFVAPRKGRNERFVLGNNLLKSLTLANVAPNEVMTYDEFLAQLYRRYGLLIGPDQVQQSGLFERQRINAESYNRNKAALLETMIQAGLAIEYSDATAIVQGSQMWAD